MEAMFVMEQFTIKRCVRRNHVSKLFGLARTLGEMSCKRGPSNTADPYTVAVTSDSFTVVGYVAQSVTSFQVVEHGYLTDHANGIT